MDSTHTHNFRFHGLDTPNLGFHHPMLRAQSRGMALESFRRKELTTTMTIDQARQARPDEFRFVN